MSKGSNSALSDIRLCASLCLETFQTTDVSLYIQRRKVLNRMHRFDTPKSSRILSYYLRVQSFFKNPTLHNSLCKIKAAIFHLLTSVNAVLMFPKRLFSPHSHTLASSLSVHVISLPIISVSPFCPYHYSLTTQVAQSLLSIFPNCSFSSF